LVATLAENTQVVHSRLVEGLRPDNPLQRSRYVGRSYTSPRRLDPFWAMPPMFLTGMAAAGAIAWINSLGNLGGFFGSWYVGV
jgi:hypothetical protein